MRTMTDREKRGILLVFAVFAFLLLLKHIPMGLVSDDSVVAPTVSEISWWDELVRHLYWNGKILTDMLANAFYRVPISVWKVFDVLVYVAAAWLLLRIFTDFTLTDSVVVTGLILFFFPYHYLNSAGYIATSTNYFYTTFCLIVVLYFLHRTAGGKKAAPWMYVTTVAANLYLANQDQTAVILAGGLTLYGIYLLIRKEAYRYAVFTWCSSIICWAVMFCLPGHLERMKSTGEMEFWLPQYADWSFFQKVYHGYSSTMANALYNDLGLFQVFCVLLFALAAVRYYMRKKTDVAGIGQGAGRLSPAEGGQSGNKHFHTMLIAAVPVFILLNVRLFGKEYFTIVYEYACGMPELVSPQKNPLPLLLTGVVLVCIALAVWRLLEGSRRLLMFLLLLLAMGARCMMGFSATIYASSFRTFIPSLYILIMCSLILWMELKKETGGRPLSPPERGTRDI